MTENEFILQDRLGVIRDIINKYGEENFCISFSGGKDSTVVHHLVDMALPENRIPRVFSNTGIEYNAIIEFVREREREDDRFVMIQPSKNIKKTLNEKGYPFKSKLYSMHYATYSRNKQETDKIIDYINSNASMKYNYDFIHNLPKGVKLSTKYYFGLEERDGKIVDAGELLSFPKMLHYQWEMDKIFNISDKCCLEMKEKPLDQWRREHKKPHRILGLMREEGGRRRTAKCQAFKGDELSFHPLAVISKEWEEWFIKTYDIKLCKLYYEPYNFDRTGCKGCPFNVNLERELSTLECYFPNERKQCEYIWKPVYDEYRRIGYRLKQEEQTKLL